MTTYDRLEEIKATELEFTTAHDTYNTAEAELVNLIGDYVMGAEVSCTAYGPGHIVAYKGTTLENLIVDVEFANLTKKFSLAHIITVARFIKFEDIFEIGSIYDEAMSVHNELTNQLKAIDKVARQQADETKKKAIEEKKLAEKYEKQKAKALKDFDELANADRPISAVDEFYYSLGWLAKNTGSFSAAMPDYLLGSFEKCFGTDYKPTVVDSKKRTVNGYAMQWALSMKASILKKAENTIPAYLTQYLGTDRKHIANTPFIWDLVENYGFKFGKKQDLDEIRNHIPSDYIDSFELALA